jgi:hypothetical protein
MLRSADLLECVLPEDTAAQQTPAPTDHSEAGEEQDSERYPNAWEQQRHRSFHPLRDRDLARANWNHRAYFASPALMYLKKDAHPARPACAASVAMRGFGRTRRGQHDG